MFALSDQPIHEHPLTQDTANADAGAFVVFAGRVRNVNQGRAVLRLEYEGAAALATHEFAQIEQETLSKFEIQDVRCVHRTGLLQIGDVAVWIGIWAAHRGPAFEACRFVIDELKKRLPIWKKEYYADGDSGWLEGG